jgi:hypothetical protein
VRSPRPLRSRLYYADTAIANLAFLANHRFGKDPVDRTLFELALGRTGTRYPDEEWQLILMYDGKVFVAGDKMLALETVLEGLLGASADAVTTAVT